MAFGWDFVLGAGERALLSFFLASSLPEDWTGFYLAQTDPDTQGTLFFWSTLDIETDGGGGTPVPDGGVGLAGLLLGLAGIAAFRRSRS